MTNPVDHFVHLHFFLHLPLFVKFLFLFELVYWGMVFSVVCYFVFKCWCTDFIHYFRFIFFQLILLWCMQLLKIFFVDFPKVGVFECFHISYHINSSHVTG